MIERQILRDLNGFAKHGELLAIMGASGAGKTSLLNILSCRISPGKNVTIKGTVQANKLNFNSEIFSKFAGYVMQNDVLMQTLTPRESFQFAANLRINASKAEKEKLVEQVLADLNLNKAADTMIGGPLLKGISGGERKRASIGVELITDPSLLFLDEPTSGLDSFTAFVIIKLLKQYAQAGKTIVFTIHQPSSDIFALFDRFMILAKGKFIFQGYTRNAVNYFANIGFKCPTFANPADYLMEIAHNDEDSGPRFEKLWNAYAENIDQSVVKEIEHAETSEIEFVQQANNWCYETMQLAGRAFKNFRRNPILFRGRVVQTLVIAFVVCSIYFRLTDDPKDPTATYDRNGALFFLCVTQFMMSMMGILLTFPSEREVFLRETGSNMYGVSAYFFGRSSTEIPFLTLIPFCFSCIIYWIIGFNNYNPGKFFIFAAILVLQSLGGNALGILAGSVFSDPKVAMAVAPLFMLPMMIFAGFYLNSDNMPVYVGWIQWISPFKYALEALVWNEYTDSPLGTATIDFLGMYLGIWKCAVILFFLGFGYRFLALLALKLLMKRMQ
eukprot:CAMPEP_0176428008 /NCGR_PEP_ID=MMETSP0127-20121128/12909_1 /TAXON_ID=938130 /ORGANISM="Platyophrya macrostoma, Strain WH" /LENGTH=556 /DNA_ID=CAMNT_0017809639 /DNA_START=239 /DNA_END=1909 /DNA_ORIENTATION=-